MTYSNLDLSRKREILVNSHSLMIAIANLAKFTGIEEGYWQTLLAQESDDFVLKLSASQIEQAITELDERKRRPLLHGAASEKSDFLIDDGA